jgi:pimeloyl-ACP methyl ester carboxylesterase
MTLTILSFILITILIVDAVVVILSYSMCWYEYANADPQLMKRRFSSKALLMTAALMGQELFFNYVTVLSMPFGLWPQRQKLQARGETQVLLLHGLFNNRASWFWFRWMLRRNGFNNVVTMNLSSWHTEERLTELVAKKVDELRHGLGVDKVHLLGHSMGGIIARNFMQLRGGAAKIDRCVCLGSPHSGSKLAPFSVTSLGQVLVPNSAFLQRLGQAPVPEGPRLTNIYSSKDNMVLPVESARLHWGENILLDGMGHTALIYRTSALRAAISGLRDGNPTDA